MKPTHILPLNQTPAIYFRPTFDVTGAMLETCIVLFLDRNPEARINHETVKAEVYGRLKQSGYAGLEREPDFAQQYEEDHIRDAERFARILFPEFFGLTQAEATQQFGSMPPYHLQHPKKASQNGTSEAAAEEEPQPEAEPEEENSITGMAAEAAMLNGNGTEKPARSGRGRPRKNP